MGPGVRRRRSDVPPLEHFIEYESEPPSEKQLYLEDANGAEADGKAGSGLDSQ